MGLPELSRLAKSANDCFRGLGAIHADGFQKQGDAYVNDQYGRSPVTLQIEVEGGVGEINLELAGEAGGA